jgi:hypothetical protein
MTEPWQAHSLGRMDLSGQVLNLDHVHERETTHSDLKLIAVSAAGSSFSRSSFTDLNVEDFHFGGVHERSHYIGCSFDRSVIRAVAPGSARFEQCSFLDVTLTEWFCFKVEFVDCRFTGTLKKVVFNGRDDAPESKPNDFFGNDFSGATLIDVDFRRGIDLSKQSLPGGDDYLFINRAKPILRQLVRRASESGDDDLSSFVSFLLQDLERDEMTDLFLTRRGWTSSRKETVEKLFRLLSTSNSP